MKSPLVYYSESVSTQKVAQAMATGGVQARQLEDISPEGADEAKGCDPICRNTDTGRHSRPESGTC